MGQIDAHEHTGYAHPPQKLTGHCQEKSLYRKAEAGSKQIRIIYDARR